AGLSAMAGSPQRVEAAAPVASCGRLLARAPPTLRLRRAAAAIPYASSRPFPAHKVVFDRIRTSHDHVDDRSADPFSLIGSIVRSGDRPFALLAGHTRKA